MKNQNQNVPPPPTPDIAIRTMESDIRSLETSGGTIAAPEFFHLTQRDAPKTEDTDTTGYGGPERPMFTHAAPRPKLSESPGMSPIVVIGIAIGVITLFGVLGYAVIFPALSGK